MTQVSKSRPKTPKQAARRNSPLDSLLNAEMFKALGDPTRLQLLSCLAKCGRPCGVSEVAQCCNVDLSVVSRHLALLEDAGILTATKKGRSVSYQVRFADLAGSLRALADAIDSCCPANCGPDCTCGCQSGTGGCCAPR